MSGWPSKPILVFGKVPISVLGDGNSEANKGKNFFFFEKMVIFGFEIFLYNVTPFFKI